MRLSSARGCGIVASVILIGASCILTGCQRPANLDAVRKLGASASAAQTSFAALVQDYHDSCTRTQRWYLLAQAESFQRHPVQSSERYISAQLASTEAALMRAASSANQSKLAQKVLHRKIIQLVQILRSAPPPSTRVSLAAFTAQQQIAAAYASCDSPVVALAMQRWGQWNRLLLGYYVALGQLAGGGSTDDAYGVKEFANALKSDEVLKTDDQTVAITNAANEAIDAALNAERTRNIADFVGPDKPGTAFVNLITQRLQNVARVYIATDLYSERVAVNEFYLTNITQVQAGTDVLTGLQSFLHRWNDDYSAIDDRQNAANSYIEALNTFKNAHDAIAADIASGKTGSLDNVVQVYLNEFLPQIRAIDKAFAGGRK